MSLIEQLTQHVTRKVRTRGDGYFWRGAVEVLDSSAESVEALVRGSDDYIVRLDRDEDAITVSCTCAYYCDRLEPCKHIWATLRVADRDGLLQGKPGGTRGPLRILTDEAVPTEWDESSDDFDDDAGKPPAPSWRPAHDPRPARGGRARQPMREQNPPWKQFLSHVRQSMLSEVPKAADAWPAGRRLLYVIDRVQTLEGDGLVLDVAQQDRKMDGEWAKPKFQQIATRQIEHLPDPDDRRILTLIHADDVRHASRTNTYYASYPSYSSIGFRSTVSASAYDTLIPLMCQTGRCLFRPGTRHGLADDVLVPLRWDDAGRWQFWLELRREPEYHVRIEGSLRRGTERVPLSVPQLLVAGGLVFFDELVAPLDDSGAFPWISVLRREGAVNVPEPARDELLQSLFNMPAVPPLDMPDDMRFEEVSLSPRPRLVVRKPKEDHWGTPYLEAELAFDYDGTVVTERDQNTVICHGERRRLIRRDVAAERTAKEQLKQLGFRDSSYYTSSDSLTLPTRRLPRVVRTLVAAGWHVEAEGKLYRTAGEFRVEVSSGLDWFELHGDVQFGNTTAKLPELLAAVKRGENVVALGDGTFGMLPEEWLKKYGMLAGLGTAQDDHLRFSRSQVGLLDALLASQPEATCDEVFTRVRDELRSFDGVRPADPPAGFVGELRDYQKIGVGWTEFLRKFSFGGCLADDMGLGKTVQVLALLESRRAERAASPVAASGPPARRRKKKPTVEPPVTTAMNGEPPVTTTGPTLVVVPKSLVFNWKQEAARFTPALRVLDHTGIGRTKGTAHFDEYDLVLTTYGTLRRDAILFKDVEFDYVILDEAQAIKNANTESAKAARLLRGRHRLALSGTPVENHLGELWSLFEFLNPGMLGSASVFRLGGAGARNPDSDTRQLLARALRPFILRRTKDQVAKELPPKLEQTLYCELEPTQRKLYDELRDHYRRALLTRVARDGMNKSKIQILEALLRLRQAAIHPGLIDKSRAAEPSAKLDLLLPQLAEVLDEGHKALVFSQFTTMLGILRDRLDARKISYEYLDGKTHDRGPRVERFQTDPNTKLFLVSLKAGGLGLNLTAAEYVFLLDPWWNPAVEAQAIDRTHRIGQTHQVFAYRLIARDTVEEKILSLQDSKRSLADAIINADNGLLRNLSREDLELLLS